ncbi:MAG: hypothetical protein ABW321_20915 [Polyangiales bacterium]
MNVLLWVLQALLAFLYLSGGAYKLFAFAEVASQLTAIPHAGWRALGAFEMVGAVLLIVPAAATPLAAAALTVETLAISIVYAQYSLELAATNPLVWSVVMGVLVAFVAYGRARLAPR